MREQTPTLFSLLDIKDYSPSHERILQRETYIEELLQRPRVTNVDVLACRIEMENIYERSTNDSTNEGQITRKTIKDGKYYIPTELMHRSPCIWTIHDSKCNL